ncbi:MAG: 16S rRNA (cytidine(1402)-2'-O)-methyltransferase [Candidatus Promineifilaceae bacterium]|jgi:16S rRNA (cytidine1402-2'-O)-methyltransferase
MPTLYLVGTPIGNLEDISLRALRILTEVTLIAAEDTRVTRRLLDRYDIKTQLISFHEYSGTKRLDDLMKLLQTGDVALVSDAGMPGLSDPGYQLVDACINAEIEIVPIPGPSAVITSLVASGLPTENFLYLGFLPRKAKARQEAVDSIRTLPYTMVIFESPQRLKALMDDIYAILGDRRISIGRELTKLYEEIWRGTVSESIEWLKEGDVRGEITVVVAGAAQTPWQEETVVKALAAEIREGASRKNAVDTVTKLSGWKKRDVYRLSLQLIKD